jgi:hypothetical protein
MYESISCSTFMLIFGIIIIFIWSNLIDVTRNEVFSVIYRELPQSDWVFIGSMFISPSEYAYRRGIAEAVGLPSIPVHPIGYYDAQKLLE